jgi:RecB family exonuclease
MRPESPTSLKQFVDCPFKYKAKYIDKSFVTVSNRYLERGNMVHGKMDGLLKGNQVGFPVTEAEVKRNAEEALETLKPFDKRAAGWRVESELELAVDSGFERVGYWDPKAWLRCKVDLLMASPDGGRIVLVDWKTGKTPGLPEQLIINAMCLTPDYGWLARYFGTFVYLDHGKCDFVNLNLSSKKLLNLIFKPMEALEKAYASGNFPPNPGWGCRWCEIEGTCSKKTSRKT